jgi:hypothetical protein
VTVSTGRPAARMVLSAACLLAVAALFGVVARLSFATTKADLNLVEKERYGASMLHPMTSLLVELASAQSAAVRGETVNQDRVRDALGKVRSQDSTYGAALAPHQRLTDLSTQIDSAFALAQTGREAYRTYSGLVDLTVDLIHRIGDTAHLVHDPDLDAYYLVDVAIVRLPDAMVYAGRAADLVTLAGGLALTGDDAMRAAVARFGVAHDAEQTSAGLRMSVDNTARAELSTNITSRLDSFLAAVDGFAPPTMLQDLATTLDARTVADGASRVFRASNELAHLLLGELQVLLDTRTNTLQQRNQILVIASVATGLVWLVVSVLLFAPVYRSRRPVATATETGVGSAPRPQRMAAAELVVAGRSAARSGTNGTSPTRAGRDAR